MLHLVVRVQYRAQGIVGRQRMGPVARRGVKRLWMCNTSTASRRSRRRLASTDVRTAPAMSCISAARRTFVATTTDS